MTEAAKIVNLTPHRVVTVLSDGRHVEFPPHEISARLTRPTTDLPPIRFNGIDIPSGLSFDTGLSTGLPSPQEGTIYIVSRAVASSFTERTDLVFPDDLVRDSSGNVVGCRRLSRLGDTNNF